MALPFIQDDDRYQQFNAISKQLSGLLALWCLFKDEDSPEVTYTQLAPLLGVDPKKPQALARKLPMPCTNPITKTAKFVWKWDEVKEDLIRLVVINTIVELAEAVAIEPQPKLVA